jgi:hypothetical protein
MLVRIRTGLKTAICNVEEMRLTKNNRAEIIDRFIDICDNLDLSQLCNLRNSQVERLNRQEIEELDRNDRNHEYVTNL